MKGQPEPNILKCRNGKLQWKGRYIRCEVIKTSSTVAQLKSENKGVKRINKIGNGIFDVKDSIEKFSRNTDEQTVLNGKKRTNRKTREWESGLRNQWS